MTLEEIKQKLASEEYGFLRGNPDLGNRIILLTLGGSHAYGTDIETSDLDVRGCALNSRMQILTNGKFEQFIDEATNTAVYGFNKLVALLANCNPNTIEMLGNRPEHYFYVSPIGRELLDNAHMFLSRRAVNSFGGYANQQLRRLENKAVRCAGQAGNEQHILKTIEHASYEFRQKYFQMPDDAIRLYTDKAVQEGYDTEIFMDVNLTHYPLRDYADMWGEMKGIVKSYASAGKRNESAIGHNKLEKHMMHLIRLYMMCLDILENEKIVTYREKEHDLLIAIRNGEFTDGQQHPVPAFYEMVDEYEKRLDYAKKNTGLPDSPDYKKINEFVASVNERVVMGTA